MLLSYQRIKLKLLFSKFNAAAGRNGHEPGGFYAASCHVLNAELELALLLSAEDEHWLCYLNLILKARCGNTVEKYLSTVALLCSQFRLIWFFC